MNIQPDFEKLLRLLECHKVKYMIVGGYAVAFHGFPRFTKDIDIYYSDSDENITNLKRHCSILDFNTTNFLMNYSRQKETLLHSVLNQ